MEQAQAKFTQARQNLNRVLPLYKKNAVSQKDRDDAQAAYDSAKADLDSAKAAVSEAEIKLSHAYVTAPVAGFASREYRTVGNLITAGSQDGSLLTVVNQNDPIYANFAIPSPQFMRCARCRNRAASSPTGPWPRSPSRTGRFIKRRA